MNKEKGAITIGILKKALGAEEYSKKTISEWVEWLHKIDILADIMVDEMSGSKYKSNPILIREIESKEQV